MIIQAFYANKSFRSRLSDQALKLTILQYRPGNKAKLEAVQLHAVWVYMYYTAAKYDPHGVSYVNYTNFTEVHCDRCKQWIPGHLSGLGMRLCKLYTNETGNSGNLLQCSQIENQYYSVVPHTTISLFRFETATESDVVLVMHWYSLLMHSSLDASCQVLGHEASLNRLHTDSLQVISKLRQFIITYITCTWEPS